MSRDDNDDLDRDAHLRQALRHAPDADAAPPAALREMILREAQAKAREGRAAPLAPAAPALRRLWDWIGTPRFAGALAGVMVIGFAGLLWRDRPPEDIASPSVQVQRQAQAPRQVQQAPAMPAEAPAAVPESTVPTAPPAADAQSKAVPTAPVEAAPPAKPKRSAAPVAKEPLAPAPAPAPLQAAPPQPSGFAQARPQAEESARDSAADAVAERRRELNMLRSQKVLGAPPPPPAAPAAARLAEAAPASLADLRLRIGSEATRWYWQRPGEASRPYDNALSDWLGRADEVSRGRWQADTGSPGGDQIVLLRNGRAAHRLRLTGDALVWERVDDGQRLRAVLDASAVAALRAALEALPPVK